MSKIYGVGDFLKEWSPPSLPVRCVPVFGCPSDVFGDDLAWRFECLADAVDMLGNWAAHRLGADCFPCVVVNASRIDEYRASMVHP